MKKTRHDYTGRYLSVMLLDDGLALRPPNL